ncbi:MAG TPA: metal-binding protein [Allocoleopsis sp.]
MASGKNHDRSILFATPIVLAVGSYQFGLEVGVIAAASHFLGGYWLSPDLDIKSAPFLRWGVLRFIWLPYQKKIPHRHWLSHSPVIGSTIRLLYLGVCLSPLWLAFPGLQQVQWAVGWMKIAAFLVGVELSALNHLLLDGLLLPLPTGIKQRLKGG